MNKEHNTSLVPTPGSSGQFHAIYPGRRGTAFSSVTGNRMKKYLLFLILILIVSCASSNPQLASIPTDRMVKANQIYVGSNLYAELITIGPNPYSESFRGIAIHYLHSNGYEWVSPKNGFRLEKDKEIISNIPQLVKIWEKEPAGRYRIYKGKDHIGGDDYFKLEWRGKPSISEDALLIFYTEAGLFGPKEKKYKIKF